MQRGKMGLAIAGAAAVAFIGGSASGQVVWTDSMEAYDPGTGIMGQGNWTAWGDDIRWDSLVSDANANSGENSLDVNGDSDTVYRFDLNHGTIDSGQWTVTTHVFIPGDIVGANGSFFILLNTYDGVANFNWSTQVRMDPVSGNFIADFSGETMPLIFDTWVELRIDIDLDNDTQDFFIGGELLYSGTWTEQVSGGGQLELQAMDLFAFSTTSIYYDDFQLEQAQSDCLELEVGPLVGGEIGEFTVVGGEPGRRGVVVWGFGGEPSAFLDINGWCATFGFDVELQGSKIRIVGSGIFDDEGELTVQRVIPDNHPGLELLFQAAEHETCPGECMSGVVEGTIE